MKWIKVLLLALFCMPAHAALQYIVGEAGLVTIVGLSSDTKPTIADGAVFLESDTAKVYLRTGGAWVESTNSAYADAPFFPTNAAETALSITPTDYNYYYGHTKRYGAACDNSADDTVEIQNAINVAGYMQGKAVVQTGTCLVDPMVIDYHNFTIEGEGRGSILKASTDVPASGAILVSLAGGADTTVNQAVLDAIYGASVVDVRSNVSGSLENLHIRNLRFQSNATTARAIHFTGFTRGCSIEGNAFENFDGAAIVVNGSWSFSLLGNHISGDGTNGTGIVLGTNGEGERSGSVVVNAPIIIGNEVTAHATGLEWDFGQSGLLSGNILEFNVGDGFESQSVEGITVSGNYFEQNGGDNIDAGGTNGTDYADSWVITGNHFSQASGDNNIRMDGVINSLIGFNNFSGTETQHYFIPSAGGSLVFGNTIHVPDLSSTYIGNSGELSITTNFVFETLSSTATAAVTGWSLGASIATTPSANDNDTSLATSAFVQSEIDDGDLLTDNCVLENDGTPIPDSCVGDGSDAGGGGGVDTANSPNANEYARFTDADTIEGRTVSEVRSHLSLVIGSDIQAWSTDLDNLVANCTVDNDATPVPDSCVGDGSDADTDTTNFNVDGDNNSPQTINATNELLIAGTAAGIDTAASATDTVTISLDLSEVAAGGELGGNLDAPTIDDTITVTGWTMGTSTATSPGANDNDTSLATSAFVQSELDDVDFLSDNCVLENDATPIPDSCVGDGSDAGGGGGAPDSADYLVGTANGSLSAEIVVGTTPGGELGNTWASPTLDDSVSVTGWTIDEINLDAGSASAGSWPNLTSGTVLTTAEDGALELDANTLYFTTDASNRGYVPTRHFIRAASTRTFTSNTSEQALFTSPANGRITLETGTYFVTGLLRFTAMSGTSGNGAVDLLGAGTATVTNWLWMANGQDRNAASSGANGGTLEISQQSAASIVTAGTATQLGVQIQGTFEVTGAGTMIPSFTMVTASASVLAIGSYITFERIGATGVVTVGQFD